jgi:hypothetical protein
MYALLLLYVTALSTAIVSYFAFGFYESGAGYNSTLYMLLWAVGTVFIWFILLLITFFVQLYRHAEH